MCAPRAVLVRVTSFISQQLSAPPCHAPAIIGILGKPQCRSSLAPQQSLRYPKPQRWREMISSRQPRDLRILGVRFVGTKGKRGRGRHYGPMYEATAECACGSSRETTDLRVHIRGKDPRGALRASHAGTAAACTFAGELCSWTRFNLAGILVLVGGAI